MSLKSILTIVVALALLSMACRISVDLPVDRITTGPTQTEAIVIPAPETSPVNLNINFDAGNLNIAPGAAAALVEGTAVYNVIDLKPFIDVQGSDVHLRTGEITIEGIPTFDTKDLKNTWDLKLGSQPMALTLQAGAFEGNLELGGLSLLSLAATSGAAKVDLNFSQPNPVEMKNLQYETGASETKLRGLANASFSTMVFRGGAGDYTFDFSGELKQDASVVIEAGLGQVTVIVPTGVPAQVNFKGGLSNVDATGGWTRSGDTYSLAGSGPTLTFTIDIGAGNLRLQTSP